MKPILTDISEAAWKKHVQDRYDELDARLRKINPNYDGGSDMSDTTFGLVNADAPAVAPVEPIAPGKRVKRAYRVSDEDRLRRANQMKAYWANKRAAVA